MSDRVIGILGGMGPEATWDLFGRILKLTPVKKDSDHHHIIIDSNSKIPDRTMAILKSGISPVNEMIATGKRLEKAGASFILMPCMTAHYFIEPVREALSIPVVNAFSLLQSYIYSLAVQPGTIAVLATSGSLSSGLYENYLSGYNLYIPPEDIQSTQVMDVIFGSDGIKVAGVTTHNVKRLSNMILHCKESGADIVIAGCTEIGLALKNQTMPLPVIDPLDLLAAEAHRIASNPKI